MKEVNPWVHCAFGNDFNACVLCNQIALKIATIFSKIVDDLRAAPLPRWSALVALNAPRSSAVFKISRRHSLYPSVLSLYLSLYFVLVCAHLYLYFQNQPTAFPPQPHTVLDGDIDHIKLVTFKQNVFCLIRLIKIIVH